MTDPRILGSTVTAAFDPQVRGDVFEQLVGASGVLIAPGIQPQYLDELVAGAEYEVLDDLKVGVSYQNRVLGRVIEDVSTDGANTYIIANPGEWSQTEENRLKRPDRAHRQRRRAHPADQPARALQGHPAVRQAAPRLQRGAAHRDPPVLRASSTCRARTPTRGRSATIPVLISYDNGQIDPNISSQYDLIELPRERGQGALPQDRRTSIKLDGSTREQLDQVVLRRDVRVDLAVVVRESDRDSCRSSASRCTSPAGRAGSRTGGSR